MSGIMKSTQDTNNTQDTTVQSPVDPTRLNPVAVAISVTVVLLILVLIIIIITRNRNKTQIFRCLSHPYQRARQSSQVGLSFANEEEEEEKEAPHETVVPEMIAPNDEGYFYDEIFDRSAFTDQSTHHSISNLFTITDYDDNPEQFSADFEGRF